MDQNTTADALETRKKELLHRLSRAHSCIKQRSGSILSRAADGDDSSHGRWSAAKLLISLAPIAKTLRLQKLTFAFTQFKLSSTLSEDATTLNDFMASMGNFQLELDSMKSRADSTHRGAGNSLPNSPSPSPPLIDKESHTKRIMPRNSHNHVKVSNQELFDNSKGDYDYGDESEDSMLNKSSENEYDNDTSTASVWEEEMSRVYPPPSPSSPPSLPQPLPQLHVPTEISPEKKDMDVVGDQVITVCFIGATCCCD